MTNGWNNRVCHVRRQPEPGIGDVDLDRTFPGAAGADHDLPSLDAVQGIDAVADQVGDHLMDLDLVDEHGRQSALEHAAGCDPFAAGPDQGERARLLDDRVNVLERPLGLALDDELAQATDDLPRPAGLLDGLFEQAREAARAFGAPIDQPARGLGVVDDRRERLIELVRERRGHLAHRAQARDVNQLRLQLLETLLALPARAHVLQEPGKKLPPGRLDLADRELERKDRPVLALAQNLATDADDPPLAGAQEALQVGVVLLAIGRGHQAGDVAPDHLGRGIAEHPLGRRIEGLDDAALVDRDQPVGRGRQDRLQQRLALRQRRVLAARQLSLHLCQASRTHPRWLTGSRSR